MIQLGASRRLAAVIALMHGGAIAAIAVLPWPMIVRIAIGCMLAIHAAFGVFLHAIPRLSTAITALRIDDAGCSWRLRRAAQWEAVSIVSVFIHPLAVVLVAKPSRGRRRALIILSDRLSAVDFSRLRARLTTARSVFTDRGERVR